MNEQVNNTPVIGESAHATAEKLQRIADDAKAQTERLLKIHKITELDDSGHVTRAMLRHEMKRIDANVSGLKDGLDVLTKAVASLEQQMSAMQGNLGTLQQQLTMLQQTYLNQHQNTFGSGPTT